MKEGIHPKYYEVEARCSCGTTWKTRSTNKELHLEILLVVPPVLHGPPEAAGHGRPHRAVQAEVRRPDGRRPPGSGQGRQDGHQAGRRALARPGGPHRPALLEQRWSGRGSDGLSPDRFPTVSVATGPAADPGGRPRCARLPAAPVRRAGRARPSCAPARGRSAGARSAPPAPRVASCRSPVRTPRRPVISSSSAGRLVVAALAAQQPRQAGQRVCPQRMPRGEIVQAAAVAGFGLADLGRGRCSSRPSSAASSAPRRRPSTPARSSRAARAVTPASDSRSSRLWCSTGSSSRPSPWRTKSK